MDVEISILIGQDDYDYIKHELEENPEEWIREQIESQVERMRQIDYKYDD